MKIPDQRLVPARHRLPVFLVAVAALAALLALGAHFAGQTDAGRFDRAVDGWFTAHTDYRAALWFADIGNPPVIEAAVLIVAAACAAAQFWRGFVLVLVATPGAASVGEWVLKPAFDRTKSGGYAYPSGHTIGTLSLALVIAVLVCGPGRRLLSRAAATLVAAAAFALAVLCGLGLIASDYHYATDVIGGSCLAVAWVGGCVLVIDLWPVRTSEG
jgi:undecaprenyl-diphosphatase